MHVPSILDATLAPVGPSDPKRPAQAHTFDLPFADGDVQIGVWECTPGTIDGTTGDFDEIMYFVAGRVTVTYGDDLSEEHGTFDLAPGTLWTTPRNWACTWTIHQTVRKMYVIDHRPGGPAAPAIFPNAFNETVGPWTPRANPIAGSPEEATSVLWNHNGVESGVWESTPGSFPLRRDGWSEVVTILSGRATIHGDDGAVMEMVPGSMYYTPNGYTGRWEVHEPIRKAYGIVRH
jgi:uncharacterized protein